MTRRAADPLALGKNRLGTAPEIVLEHLRVGWGERVVIKDISARIPAGKVTVILGGSGGGKSTLLRHLLGLAEPMAGRILHDGRCLGDMTQAELRALRTRMGVLFQDGALLGSYTLGENVAMPLYEHAAMDEDEVERVVRGKLGLVGLEPFIHYYPRQLSGGMRKRAGLARALAMDPRALFCDEPSSGLDPITAAELDELILGLKAAFGMTIVVVSHDLDSMFKIADHVLMIRHGGLAYEGNAQGLRESSDEFIRSFVGRMPGARRNRPAADLGPARRD